MLIELPYKIGEIVSFKLTSGEEVLGRLEEENDKVFTLHKPMLLIMGQQGLGLAPFMFSVSPDAKFKIQAGSVSCVAKTQEDIAKQYTAQTTGIHI
jgi:hypothetical protein